MPSNDCNDCNNCNECIDRTPYNNIMTHACQPPANGSTRIQRNYGFVGYSLRSCGESPVRMVIKPGKQVIYGNSW